MSPKKTRIDAFSLLELLMAMAVFAIAAVSLAQAISLISLSVVESIDEGELREQLRGELLAASRDPYIEEGSRETAPNENEIYFRIVTSEFRAENREGIYLDGLFEIEVTALRRVPGGDDDELDVASTVTYPGIF